MSITQIKDVRYILFLLIAIALIFHGNKSMAMESPAQTLPSLKDYSISIQASELEEGKIQLVISTNIPGNIELMAGISLRGQAGDDIYIGKSNRVSISNGEAVVFLDASDLPSGEYDAEANFYPLWGLQDEESKSAGIDYKINALQRIQIGGSGEDATLVAKRNEDQRWVMENIIIGTPWNPIEWTERFGSSEEFPVTSMNPEIIKNYYFSSIDMTVIVNVLKVEIVTWRMGKDGL